MGRGYRSKNISSSASTLRTDTSTPTSLSKQIIEEIIEPKTNSHEKIKDTLNQLVKAREKFIGTSSKDKTIPLFIEKVTEKMSAENNETGLELITNHVEEALGTYTLNSKDLYVIENIRETGSELFSNWDRYTEEKRDRIVKQFLGWYSTLTLEERDAIAMYKSNGFASINNFCRTGEDSPIGSWRYEGINGSEGAERLTELFETSPRIKETVLVSRMISTSEFNLNIFGGHSREELIARSEPGVTTTEEAFVSTDCTMAMLKNGVKNKICMMIEVPEGSKIIPAHLVTPNRHDDEEEFILPRKTEITVFERVYDQEKDIYYVYAKARTP